MLPCLAPIVVAICTVAQPPATASVSGFVLDALGDPVPLAQVWITTRSSNDVVARTATDGSGMFALARLPAGDGLVVRATTEGKIEAATSAAPVAWLRLWDAGTIRGRVVDPNGVAVAGAEVVASFDDARVLHSRQARCATTAADGSYELHKVPLGMIDVRAAAPGRVMAAARVHLRDAATCDLIVADGDGVQVTVHIDGLGTEDLAGVEIELLPYRDGSLQTLPHRLVRGQPDKAGVWRSSGLPDYKYLVRASGEVAWFPSQVELRAGSAPYEVTVTAQRRGGVFVTGRLTDVDGKPLHGETVGCIDSEGRAGAKAKTAEDGGFRIECTAPAGGRCTLYLSGSNCVLDGGEFVTIIADPLARLELRAVPAEWASVRGRIVGVAGEPLRLQPLRLEDEQPNRTPLWSPIGYEWTDVDGKFEFARLRPRPARVRVTFSGFAGAGASEPFELDSDTEDNALELRAVAPASVEGIVRDAAGKPVPGARVWLRTWLRDRGQLDHSVTEVITDRTGRYRHAGVAPGDYFLQLFVDGKASAAQSESFELLPGQRLQRDL